MRLLNRAWHRTFQAIRLGSHAQNIELRSRSLIAPDRSIAVLRKQPTLSIKRFLDSLHLVQNRFKLNYGVVVLINALGLLVSWPWHLEELACGEC